MARRWKNKAARRPPMAKLMRKVSRPFRRRTEPGASPGTLVVDPLAPKSVVSVIAQGPGPADFLEKTFPPGEFDGLAEIVERYRVTWVNVDGLGDAATIEGLGKLFCLHPLALEDVVHVHQRSKVEDYEEHLFVVSRMVEFDASCNGNDAPASGGRQPPELSDEPPRTRTADELRSLGDECRPESEQVSLFLGQKYVLTFQERPGVDSFDPVRSRLRRRRTRFLELGADYLAYALIDAIVDGYFPVLEELGARLDRLDADILACTGGDHLTRLHRLRGDLLMLRKNLWPLREAIHALVRDPHPLVSAETHVFLRDCYDHTVQLLDVVETYRELCADLREYHYSQISTRTNEVVKTLTIISTIFIPLSFVAGVYGMNFDPDASPYNMPELRARYGYPATLAFMAVVGLGLLAWMWRRGWLRREKG
jgi:magnesium transporter